jgi:hypothetical protein
MIRSDVLRLAIPMLIASPALADPSATAGCARTLSPAALEVYRAAAPDLRPDSDLRVLLRAKVIPLVITGEMSTTTARTAAIGASICLRSLQQQAGAPIGAMAITHTASAD